MPILGWALLVSEISLSPYWKWGGFISALGVSWFLLGRVMNQLSRPWLTLSSLLEALAQGDYSYRGRHVGGDPAVEQAFEQLNSLAQSLQSDRLRTVETNRRVEKVLTKIDSPILAFDPEYRILLANPASAAMLGSTPEDLVGRTAEGVGLQELLDHPPALPITKDLPGGWGRWQVRVLPFREEGRLHRLLLMTELSQSLRAEEKQSHENLIRVLAHELNNSLAPIRSTADTLRDLANLDLANSERESHIERSAGVISRRIEGLQRFMSDVTSLQALPAPRLAPVPLAERISHVVDLLNDPRIEVVGGPEVSVLGDADQLEQIFINLLKNGLEALPPEGGQVTISWIERVKEVEIGFRDNGSGLPEEAPVFLPFFSTKKEGSGIGLALSQQIAEAHRGKLRLRNRRGQTGAIATLQLDRVLGATGRQLNS